MNDRYATLALAANVPTSTPGPGATGRAAPRERRNVRRTDYKDRMAGISSYKHDTCSKPAMSITGDPWSTTGSSAARSPCRSTQYAASAASCWSSTHPARSCTAVPHVECSKCSLRIFCLLFLVYNRLGLPPFGPAESVVAVLRTERRLPCRPRRMSSMSSRS